MSALHPSQVLFQGEAVPPALPPVDHYAGSEKLILKAHALQRERGPRFDITCDCEDGAPAGREAEHATLCAELVMSTDNAFGRVGARIHDHSHPHWRADLDILVRIAGTRLAYLTLPKPRALADVESQLAALRLTEQTHGIGRRIPVHVLVETHGALRDAWAIAQLPGVECLDFGLMDFVSAHHGAIPSTAMRSPGQFDHPLLRRAKCEVAAAALGNGVVPAHNVTTALRDTEIVTNDARRAREEFGFLRMWSIHPDQIDPIAEALLPKETEIETASAILLAAQAAHWGPIRHDDTLHDRASYRYFWALLARAHAAGARMPADAHRAFFSNAQ